MNPLEKLTLTIISIPVATAIIILGYIWIRLYLEERRENKRLKAKL